MSDWTDNNVIVYGNESMQVLYNKKDNDTVVVDTKLNWSSLDDIIDYCTAIIAWLESGANGEPPNPRQFQKRLPL